MKLSLSFTHEGVGDCRREVLTPFARFQSMLYWKLAHCAARWHEWFTDMHCVKLLKLYGYMRSPMFCWGDWCMHIQLVPGCFSPPCGLGTRLCMNLNAVQPDIQVAWQQKLWEMKAIKCKPSVSHPNNVPRNKNCIRILENPTCIWRWMSNLTHYLVVRFFVLLFVYWILLPLLHT